MRGSRGHVPVLQNIAGVKETGASVDVFQRPLFVLSHKATLKATRSTSAQVHGPCEDPQ
jgi:hypothetical protein